MEAVEGEDEEDRNDRNSNELVASASGTLGGSKGKFYFAEMSAIDPELWRQEAERVTPLLRKHEANIGQVGGLSATWRSHLDLLMKHVTEVILGQPSRATKDAVPAFTSSNIADFISSLRTNLQESLQKIQHMEKLLCGRAAFTGFSLEYESYNKVWSIDVFIMQHFCVFIHAAFYVGVAIFTREMRRIEHQRFCI